MYSCCIFGKWEKPVQLNDSRLTRLSRLSVFLAWMAVTTTAIALVTAITTLSFWTTALTVGGWLVLTQMLYIIFILYLTAADHSRQRKLLLRGDGQPFAVFPVNSRMIDLVGFDETSETLMIEFHDGHIKFFHPVTESMYRNLREADSPGTYYRRHLRHLWTR